MAQKSATTSRRGFLKAAAAIGIGAVFDHTVAQAANHQTNTPSDDWMVPKRPFGCTGVQVPILALGGMFNTGSNLLLLKQAVKWGVTYWDTAMSYNRWGSEEGIGKYFTKYPEDRNKIFLVTKALYSRPEVMDDFLNISLNRLKTDCIDLYFVHAVDDVSKQIPEETKRWSEKAKASGKIKLFGFSTHKNMAQNLMVASKLGFIDGIMFIYNYRFMHDDDMKWGIEACVKAGIGLTAMKTQAMMEWGHWVGEESDAALKLTERFLKKGFTEHQARLKVVLENTQIASVCSQMDNMTFLKANVKAAVSKEKLSSNDRRLLENYARATTSHYCSGCAMICEPAVQGESPIADVMRCLMYKRSYGDYSLAVDEFKKMSQSTRSRLTTLDYERAERLCPRNIPIGQLICEAVEELG